MYVRIQTCRINYIQTHQEELQCNMYEGIVDDVEHEDSNTQTLGRVTTLPPAFIGDPHHFNQLYQETMALVREFRKPSVFITMTCNPKWPKIKAKLLLCQKAIDCFDIISCVFNLKYKEMLKDLTKRHVRGRMRSHCHQVRWQK